MGIDKNSAAAGKIFTELFINNEFVPAKSGKTFETINANDKSKIADVSFAQKEDVDLAVSCARAAFPSWTTTSPVERQRILIRIAELLEAETKEFAYLEALDGGKPISTCAGVDLPSAANTFRYYSGWAAVFQGDQIPMFQHADNKYHTYTRREAVGVVGAIIPWNFPLVMLAWKVGPALAAGCTVVLKPSEKTPLTALKFADLARRAGLPPGVLNVVPGFGNPTGEALCLNENVDKIAFTGSTKTGRMIQKKAIDADGHLRRISLELGGKSPLIVLPDADIDEAVKIATIGLFFNCGQCCIASTRIYVHESIADVFIKRIVEVTRKERLEYLGHSLDESTVLGPIVDATQYESVMSFIKKGISEGATCVIGGKSAEDRLGGYHVEPTIFTGVKDDMTICKEEIFGPVLSILTFQTLDEAIQRANNSPYGLGAGVATKDLAKAHYVAAKLRAGSVYVNCWNVLDPAAPFGGFKDSGLGRELGKEALALYTECKTVIMDISHKQTEI